MKTLKKLFTLLLAITMLLPLTVRAENEQTETKKEPARHVSFVKQH